MEKKVLQIIESILETAVSKSPNIYILLNNYFSILYANESFLNRFGF